MLRGATLLLFAALATVLVWRAGEGPVSALEIPDVRPGARALR